jgi:ribonuclease HII
MKIQKFEINEEEFIGVDEVGRGSLIGPVITCAVYLNYLDFIKLNTIPFKIDDSKKITKKNRKLIIEWINCNNIKYFIDSASVIEIDELNIREANNLAMNRSIFNLLIKYKNIYSSNPNKLINCYIDGNYFNPLNIFNTEKDIFKHNYPNFHTIIKGDTKNIAIALASIIAKEYRDDLIIKLGSQQLFKPYNWYKNMGYGTKEHLRSILINGITIHHRLSFLNKLLYKK